MIFNEKLSQIYGLNQDILKQANDGYQNFVLEYDNIIFRVSNSNRRSPQELLSEFEYISHLAENGLSVSKHILSPNGNLFEEIDGHFVAVFEKAQGLPVDVTNPRVWNGDLFFNWGKFIGKMHFIGDTVNEIARPRWSAEVPDLLKLMPKIQSDLMKQRYEELLGKLTKYQVTRELFGLIHNDFHQGNFFVHNGQIMAFDFDDCAYHWKAYDLAVSFYHAHWQASSFFPEDRNFSETFWCNFLKGYQQFHPIEKELLEQIPIFLKIRELFLYTLFLEKWDLNNLEDWQSFTLEDLKQRITFDNPHPTHIKW